MKADDMEKFIEDQKAKVAQDKAELENDPPYMEMRNKDSEKLPGTSKMFISMAKENIPPNSQQNCPSGGYGWSLPLGEEYERKKHKLKEELQQDYRRYLSQKNYLTTCEVDPCTQGLSLPIDERRSAKERLRLERNREYNQYLREKEEWNQRLWKLGKRSTENEMDRNTNPLAVTRLQAEPPTEVQPCGTGAEPPKKDAFTSTESYEELQSRRWLEEDGYQRLDDEAELRRRLLMRRPDADLDAPSRRQHGFASQAVVPVRRQHRPDEDHDFGRRSCRMECDPEMGEEQNPRVRCESTYDRTPRALYGERNQVQVSSAAHEQSRSAAAQPHATGLAVGVQDPALLQRKKEQYRQELLEQMAEQQRNRRREKELKLSVAVSGAQDPEKKPNRLKQLGLSARASEEPVPPERPQVAFQTPVPQGPSASPRTEELQRGLPSTVAETAVPRLAPPPAESCSTPWATCCCCGGRNPPDPSPACCGTGMGVQPTPNQDPPLSQAPAEQPVSTLGQRNPGDRQRSMGIFSEEKPKPSREATVSYQQELQQQIREREQRRRREREEKELYEAKLEAELRNYNPWGKGGGGAPLRDTKGNLIADLYLMHKQNEDAYLNPGARFCEDKRAVVSVDLSLASPRPENTEASTNKIAGFPSAQTSPFARGNVFGEPRSPQHLRRQESYKNFLRMQIEEKRRKKEAEREKLRLEEEKEEKWLAEQRLRIQKEYEEEQEERRRKEEEQRQKNKEMIRLNEERLKEAEKRRKREEKEDERLQQGCEKERMEEEKRMLLRQPSPIIPALQNKAGRREERIPSAESHLSYCAQDPSPPRAPSPRAAPPPRAPSPPVPARRNQLRAIGERKTMVSELSEMRKQLHSEERWLQEQLLNTAREQPVPTTRDHQLGAWAATAPACSRRRRERNPKDMFDLARLRPQIPVRRPSLQEAQEPVNLHNIWDFNELKYQDSETRVGLRHMYPDPPRDDHTLEIQQQALLREQQKKLDRMRMRRGSEDYSAPGSNLPTMGLFRKECNEFLKSSLLESDSAFIDANGEMFPALEEVDSSPELSPSARERRRLKQKALECAEDVPGGQTPSLPPDSSSSRCSFSPDVAQLRGWNEELLHGLAELQHKAAYSGDTGALPWTQAPSQAGRCSSADTVATEAWLRPGTSETLQSVLDPEHSPAKAAPARALPLRWQGLSTAHG